MASASTINSALPLPEHRSAAARYGAIDVLRMAAVIPIVFYHAGVLDQTIALIGMHALIAAAVVFAANGRSKGSTGQMIARRADRLLWPWLFFGLLHLVLAAKNHAVRPWMFFIGGSVHLWFLPFIFIVTCAVALAKQSNGLQRGWAAATAWSMLALGLISIEALYTPIIVDRIPAWQFLDGATAVLVILAAYCVPETAGRFAPLAVALLLTALSVALWLPLRAAGMMWAPPAGIGAALFLAVSHLPTGSNAVTDFLGRTSFGLYLLHPLMQRVISLRAAHWFHVAPEAFSRRQVIECSIATIIASVLTIAIAERTPLRKIVI